MSARNKALFLDWDGVIKVDKGYFGRVEEFEFVPGVLVCRRAQEPNPEMLFRARDDFALDLTRSVLIGDRDSDLAAGRAAGVGFNVRLRHELSPGDPAHELEFATLQAIGDWLERTFAPAPG